jgi:hypothetical protein
MVPAVMGMLIMLNAAIAKGPASAFPLVGRTVHRWLDVLVMLLLVVALFQPAFDVDSTGRLLLGAMAFVMFFIWLNSDFSEKTERRQDKQQQKAERRARPGSEEIGKKAGRFVGGGVNAAKRFQGKMKGQQ